jgi:hypothetical protein
LLNIRNFLGIFYVYSEQPKIYERNYLGIVGVVKDKLFYTAKYLRVFICILFPYNERDGDNFDVAV